MTSDLTALLPRPGQAAQGAQRAKPGVVPAVPLADLKAAVTADSTEAALTNLSIAFDSAGRPEVLAGSAQFSWDGELKTEARLTTPWLDLDNVLGNPEGGNPLLALASFAQRINSLVPGKGTTTTRLEIDSASLGHDAVSGVLVDARSTAGLLALEQVRATLPGGSKIEIQGSIAGQDSTTTFDGDMTLRGTSLARFANWATGGGLAITPANDQSFQMRGRVTIEPTRSGLSDIAATIGDSTLDGSIGYSWENQRVLLISIGGAQIDARAVAPEKTSLRTLMRFAANRLASQTGAARGGNEGDAIGIQFNLSTAELVLPDQTLRDVTVKMDRSLQGVNIERLQFSAAHGVAVNIAGNIADLMREPQQAPNGSGKIPMRGSLAAGDLDGLKTLANLLDLPASLGLERLPASLLPMRLAGTLGQSPAQLAPMSEGAPTTPLSLVAEGRLGQIDTKIRVGLAAGLDTWRSAPADIDVVLLAPADIRLTAFALALLRNRSPDVLRQLAAIPPDTTAQTGTTAGVSRLALRASGVPQRGLSTSLRIDSPDLTAYLFGTSLIDDAAALQLSGDLALDARDGRDLLGDAGGLRLAFSDPLSLRGQARLETRDGTIGVTSLALVANDGAQIAGHLRLEPGLSAPAGDAPPPRRLTGALDVTTLKLATLLSTVAVPQDTAADTVAVAAAAASKDSPAIWPPAAFDFGRVSDVDMAIKLTSGTLILADGIVVADADFTLLGRRDTLEIRDLVGTSLGGRVTATALLEHVPAGAALTARIGLAGAQLAAFGSTGAADLLLMLSGSGLNPAGLAASLSGGGAINLGQAEVRAVTPGSLQTAIDAALKTSPDKLSSVLRAQLASDTARPAIAIGPRALKVTVEDGVAHAEPLVLTTNEGRVVGQAALDLTTFGMTSDWRVETRLQPLPALPVVAGNTAPAPPAATIAPVPLPAVVERFLLSPAGLAARVKSPRPPPETDALERELAVRKVERDLAELERLRRLDELRAAEARAKEAQDVEQADWKKQTETKPVVRPEAPAAPAKAP